MKRKEMYCNTGRPQSDDWSKKTTSNDIEAGYICRLNV